MLLRNSVLLAADGQIRTEVGQAFNALLLLVREVSLYYSSKLQTGAEEVSFDSNGMFGGQIAAFYQRKNHIVDAMWEHSLGDEATIEVRILRKWLGPQDAGLQNLIKVDDMPPADAKSTPANGSRATSLPSHAARRTHLLSVAPLAVERACWLAGSLNDFSDLSVERLI